MRKRFASLQTLNTTTQVLDELGGFRAVQEKYLPNYSANRVENWKRYSTFPPETYLVLTQALRARGKAAPPSLWRMVGFVGQERRAS